MRSPTVPRLVIAAALLIVGCASDPPRRLPALDPSDPSTSESAGAPTAPTAAAAPAPATNDHAHHHMMNGHMMDGGM